METLGCEGRKFGVGRGWRAMCGVKLRVFVGTDELRRGQVSHDVQCSALLVCNIFLYL